MALDDRLDDPDFRKELAQSRFFLATQDGRLEMVYGALNLTPKFATVRAMERGVTYTMQGLDEHVPRFYGLDEFVVRSPSMYLKNRGSQVLLDLEICRKTKNNGKDNYTLAEFGELLQPVVDAFVPLIAEVGIEPVYAIGGPNSSRRVAELKFLLYGLEGGTEVSMNEFNFVRKEKGAIVADLAGVGLIEYTYMHPDKGASIHFVPNKPRLETLAKSSIAEVKEIFGCKRGIARCIINAANAASQLDEFSYSDLLQRGLTIRTLGSALPKLAVKGYLDRIGPKTRTAARINEKGQKLVKVIRFLDDFCADPIGVARGLSSDIPHNAYHEMFEIYQRDRVKPGDAIEKVTAALGDEPVLLSDLAERTGLKKGSIGNVLRDLKARGLVVNENRRWRRADKEQVTA